MATTFKLKRKLYSDDEKKGMGTGTKLALGAATIAGGFYGARKGMFGNTARMAANRGWMKAGQMVGNKGMIKSGARDYATGAVNKNIVQATKVDPNFKMTDMEKKRNIIGQQNMLIRQYTPKTK